MAKILSFPRPGDCCANCKSYVQLNLYSYCSNPEIMDASLAENVAIGELNLNRKPEHWCPQYKRAEWLNDAQKQ